MSIKVLAGEVERKRGIHYEFDTSDEPLGVGGTGKVFRGKRVDEKTGMVQDVAIKFLYSDLSDNVIERARREANIQFRNDNLVEMYGFFEIEERDATGKSIMRYHVVSELLEGVMLDDLLQGKTVDHDGNEIPFAQKLYKDYLNDPIHFGIYVLKQVLSGVMVLHDAGYIHRDIDPTNIMITKDGRIKLIDFGIAKQLQALTTHDRSLTSVGQFIGKALYSAPELVLGDIKHQDRTTDIYALGILLFQFVVGRLPFEGDTPKVLEMQVHQKMPLGLVKQKALRQVIAKATAKKQSARYQTAAEFRVALEGLDINDGHGSDGLDRDFLLKKVLPALLALVLLGVLVYVLTKSEGNGAQDFPDGRPVENVDVDRYATAVSLLKSADTATKGLEILDSLVTAEHSDATYLMSRLYFKSKSLNDLYPDSIRLMQGKLQIPVNHEKAHELLLKTVELDPDNYQALYELGCDYLGGQSRTTAVERDLDVAESYFNSALQYAEGDSYYEELIEDKLSRCRLFK